MRKTTLFVAGLVFFGSLFSHTIYSQTTAFTYQGILAAGGSPANGNHDFEFALFDAASGGIQLGSTQTLANIPVAAGVFSVQLNFGNNFPGADRFVEVRVRPSGPGGFTTLSPRQAITSAPYSVRSLSTQTAANADTAVNAINAVNATNAQQLNGIAASQYVLTTDSRMSDARNPLPGSPSYIQNTNSLQTASNFNVSGSGSANAFNATTGYELGGSRILSNAGTNNLFAGISSGSANTSGSGNAFFGSSAGFSNTIGTNNVFVGASAGSQNNSGNSNSFVGSLAGSNNTSGFNNSFFGRNAGVANTTASSNAFFGAGAGAANTTGGTNAFFGSQAGANNVAGGNNSIFGASAGFNGTIASNNSFFGRNAGLNAAGGDNSFFGNSSGINTTAGTNNTFFGGSTGLINTIGTHNTLVGFMTNVGSNNLSFATAIGAGSSVGSSNTIVLGRNAGQDLVSIPGSLSVLGTLTGTLPSGSDNYIQNTATEQAASNFNISGNGTLGGTLSASVVSAVTQFNIGPLRILGSAGSNNLFAGFGSGSNNTGINNAFFGAGSGGFSTAGSGNSLFGSRAGQNQTGASNSFFGERAGSNSSGSSNAFFGAASGLNNNTGQSNSFFGNSAGLNNGTGSNNAFFGANVGPTNSSGSDNSLFGAFANVTNGATNATAIGSRALVSQSNSLVLGGISGVNGATSDTNVGIGTTTPERKLHVRGAGNVEVQIESSDASGRRWTLQSSSGANNGRLEIIDRTANAGRLTILGDGNVGVGTTIPADRLHVNGILRVITLGPAGATTLCRNVSNQISTCSSSERYKSNIAPLQPGLDLVNRLRPVSFNWKDGGMPDMGLVAEEVADVEPLLVTQNNKGEIEGVKYDRVGVVLINAVKEQQAQIETLRQQVELLTKLLCKTDPDADVCRE